MESIFEHDFEDNIPSIMDAEVEDEYIMPKGISLSDILTEDVNCLSILLTKIKISELDSIWYYAVRNNLYKEQCYRNNMDYIKAFKDRFINGAEEEEEDSDEEEEEDSDEEEEPLEVFRINNRDYNREELWEDVAIDNNYIGQIYDAETEEPIGTYGCEEMMLVEVSSDITRITYKHFIKYNGQRKRSFWCGKMDEGFWAGAVNNKDFGSKTRKSIIDRIRLS